MNENKHSIVQLISFLNKKQVGNCAGEFTYYQNGNLIVSEKKNC